MSDLVAKFGSYLGRNIAEKPDRVRKLLLTAYKLKRVQLKHFPDKRLSPARNMMAVSSMNAVIAPLADPANTALVNIFMPCELLQAFGIHPMFAEAMASYINGAKAEKGFVEYAEACGLPETFCSYHKVLLGAILSDVIPKPRFVVNTSLLCDANNLTFRMAAEHYQIPQIYIDVPYDSSEDSVQYVADQLRDLTSFLEEETGRKLDQEALCRAVDRSGSTMQRLLHCQELKKDRFLHNDITSELYEVFGTHVLLGTEEIEQYSLQMEKDILASAPTKGVRILWIHTIPYYQQPVRRLFNFNERCQILCCDMNLDPAPEMDGTRPYESMARRLVYDAFNGSAERRIGQALRYAEKMDADGAVYFCHWGCKQTTAAAGLVKRSLEEQGLPTLILDGDACDRGNSSNGQMATRLEAFIEMLEKRK